MDGHVSVLLDECIENLNIRPDGIYVDGTLGLGGHSRRIAERLSAGGRLIAIDRDTTALERASEVLRPWAERVTLVHGTFGNIRGILEEQGIPGVDGVLLDLGVSSPQLDEAERGFSYRMDAPLDMRMDRSSGKTAADVVNSYMPGGSAGQLLQPGQSTPLKQPWSWPSSSAAPCPHRRSAKSSTRPKEAFRPSASRSTTSCVR